MASSFAPFFSISVKLHADVITAAKNIAGRCFEFLIIINSLCFLIINLYKRLQFINVA